MSYDGWNNLPKDILIDVVQRLGCPDDYYRLTAVCKSWNSVAPEAVASLADSVIAERPWWLLLRFPRRIPMLLLAEEVAPGSIRYDTEFDLNKDYSYDEEGYYDDDDDDEVGSYDYLKNSVGTLRGLYSLSSMKTYNIELPEAAGKLILSTSKEWLLTLGRDLEMNLLHPLLRHQISLPPMLTFPAQCVDWAGNISEAASEQFIRKVAMSSKLPSKVSFSNHKLPIVMVIYHIIGLLGFARLGDEVWSDVDVISDIIKPNSIYFTDDNWESFFRLGGGHDMGIFDLEHHTVEPHYPRKSIHCISPPLWYI